jgi:hypothetical protein
MSQVEEKMTKSLADLKAYLERKLSEHEQEAVTLRSFLQTIDDLLAEKSYRRVHIPKSIAPESGLATPTSDAQSIRTISGVELASMYVEGRDLRVVPSQEFKFDANAPPMKSFLIGKVLEPLHRKDEESTRKQELTPDQVLMYIVNQEGNRLKELYVKNFGDERRLNELKNALRWTFRRMYEKTIGTQ